MKFNIYEKCIIFATEQTKHLYCYARTGYTAYESGVAVHTEQNAGWNRGMYTISSRRLSMHRKPFRKYALPLFNDRISALPFGPVPSLMYNILRVARGESQPYRFCDDRVLSRIAAAIDYQDESFTANEQPDMECLSKSNIECLDEAIGEVSRMRFDKVDGQNARCGVDKGFS